MEPRALAIMLVIGLVAGWLASFIMGGSGLIRYIATGVIGAFVGGYLVNWLNIDLGIGNPLVSQVIIATAGAIIVIAVAKLLA